MNSANASSNFETFLLADQDLLAWEKRHLWTDCHCKISLSLTKYDAFLEINFKFFFSQKAFAFLQVSPCLSTVLDSLHVTWILILFSSCESEVQGLCLYKPICKEWSFSNRHTMPVSHLKLRCPSPKRYRSSAILANCFVILCVHSHPNFESTFPPKN